MPHSLAMKGACHCGAVQFSVVLSDGLDEPRRCNCSYCRMRGSVVVTAAVDDITIESGADELSLYQFNTHAARHYFCSRCGISTHHRRRSNPSLLSVNTACLKGISPFDFSSVPVYEGVVYRDSGVPGDEGEIAGALFFVKSDSAE